jgi:hypothetical protein
MADDFASFNRKLDDFRSELDGTKLKAKLDQIGKAAKDDAAKAVQGDLGDQSMSNWRRGSPFKIEARYDLKGDHEIEVTPTPRARGPWRVLEDGRRGGSATDLVLVGRVRKKSGTRRAKSRGRNQGATAGKNTWSEAVEIMERETPKRVDRYVVEAAIRKSGV